jgi:alkylated DNA repair dioxygenase AlkB
VLLLVLKILGGVLALAIGLYWGLSGQFRQTPEEVDRALGLGGRSRRAKRHFTPLGWMRKDQRASHRRRQSRQPFKTAAPKDPNQRT